MKLAGRPELTERLCAEYALGTLRGRARARFTRRLREDAALARAAAGWEQRLAPLLEAVAPVAPPPRLWRRIEERLAERRAPAPGLWRYLAFWRGLGLAASGATAVLLATVVLLWPQRAPEPAVAQLPASEVPAVYLAVLTDPATRRPALVVSAGRSAAQLAVKTLDPAIHVAGRSLELWALPAQGAPRSLGLVAPGEKAVLALAAAADRALEDVPALAVSLEPPGGSPTGAPTGPVLASGPCVKYW